ncbi:uncharacterized protein LOC117029767 isoform X2 [Rhinolophus ferrumequinum]|uniref:uncharacterized protein LOC117029767 isoform X2 n=1 Tax=Rhinolophus ferrumequinum TaxID=59479 RepID=UPI00140FD9C5|nr:uncharacterized protein LOC117029767 isoform X2 [Rhinolophus ferrumequinum]
MLRCVPTCCFAYGQVRYDAEADTGGRAVVPQAAKQVPLYIRTVVIGRGSTPMSAVQLDYLWKDLFILDGRMEANQSGGTHGWSRESTPHDGDDDVMGSHQV